MIFLLRVADALSCGECFCLLERVSAVLTTSGNRFNGNGIPAIC